MAFSRAGFRMPLLGLLCGMAAVVVLAGAAASQLGTTVRGVVVDSLTGLPVPDARISLQEGATTRILAAATTEADGAFALPGSALTVYLNCESDRGMQCTGLVLIPGRTSLSPLRGGRCSLARWYPRTGIL